MTPVSGLIAIVDVAIVSYGVYRLFLLIRGTRAIQLVKGIILLLLAVPVSNWLRLNATHMVLKDIQTMLIVAIPIVFQPELRRALEQLGQGRFFAQSLLTINHEEVDITHTIDELARATDRLSRSLDQVQPLMQKDPAGGSGHQGDEVKHQAGPRSTHALHRALPQRQPTAATTRFLTVRTCPNGPRSKRGLASPASNQFAAQTRRDAPPSAL